MRATHAGFVSRSWTASKAALSRIFRKRRHGTGTGHPLLPRHPAFYAVIALTCISIAGCMLWFDLPAAQRAKHFYTEIPQTLYFFKQLTKLGSSGWILVLSGSAALYLSATRWWSYHRRDRLKLLNLHADATFTFFLIGISGILVWLLKNLIGRARPKMLDITDHLHFDPAAFQAEFASFPSGHATTTGALAIILVLLLPKLRLVWIGVGIAAGFSRVVVGAHYPSDVICGLALGAFFSWLVARFLAQRGIMFRQRGGYFPERVRAGAGSGGNDGYEIAAKPLSRSPIRSSASSRPT